MNCHSLPGITLPSKIKKIHRYAFAKCKGIKSVRIPASVEHLGEEAFPSTTKLIWAKPGTLTKLDDGSWGLYAKVKIIAKQMYSNAFAVLNQVNAERKKRGLAALSMDKGLLEAAMLRAAETSLYWSHEHPTSQDCFTASGLMSRENIACGQSSPKSVMNSWMNSAGHKANILANDTKSIGIGCVLVDGYLYWVQCFGANQPTSAKASSYKDAKKTHTIIVATDKEHYRPTFNFSATTLKKAGAKAKVTCRWYNGFYTVSIPAASFALKTSESAIATSSKGVIRAKGGGSHYQGLFPGLRKRRRFSDNQSEGQGGSVGAQRCEASGSFGP